MAFGIQSLTSRFMNPEPLHFNFGTTQPLTRRLNTLLREYADDYNLPKELFQNADQAGSTCIKFLYDERENEVSRAISDGMADCQGPALWIYHNSQFTDTDYQNIVNVKGEGKIGRFGLGFNVVYYLTDVPTIVSGPNVVIFDPHTTHMRSNVSLMTPGIKLHQTRDRHRLKRLSNQFRPFHRVFGCELGAAVSTSASILDQSECSYPGTLIRLPLRTRAQATKGLICSKAFTDGDAKALLSQLIDDADTMLLFSQNICEIGVYHLTNGASDSSRPIQVFNSNKSLVKLIRELSPLPTVPLSGAHLNDAMQKLVRNTSIAKATSMSMEELKNSASSIGTPNSSSSCTSGRFPSSSLVCRLTDHLTTAGAFLLSRRGLTGEDSDWLVVSHMSEVPAVHRTALRQHLLPYASVAIRVQQTHSGQYTCIPNTPLSPLCFGCPLSGIQVALPVLISSQFSLTPDRRHLTSTPPPSSHSSSSAVSRANTGQCSNLPSWNEIMFSDPICIAYFLLLEDVCKMAGDLDYTKAWPNIQAITDSQLDKSCDQEGVRVLVTALYTLIARCRRPVFRCLIGRLSIVADSYFIDDIVYQHCPEISQKLLTLSASSSGSRCHVVRLPNLAGFKLGNCENLLLERSYDINKILDLCVHFESHLSAEDKGKVAYTACHWIADSSSSSSASTSLLNRLRTLAYFVDSAGTLRRADQLVMPESKAAILFSAGTKGDRCPHQMYMQNEKVTRVLVSLGCRSTVVYDIQALVEVGQSLGALNDINEKLTRVKSRTLVDILEKLDEHEFNSAMLEFQDIAFLPSKKRPQDLSISIPWQAPPLLTPGEAHYYTSPGYDCVLVTCRFVDDALFTSTTTPRLVDYLGNRDVDVSMVTAQIRAICSHDSGSDLNDLTAAASTTSARPAFNYKLLNASYNYLFGLRDIPDSIISELSKLACVPAKDHRLFTPNRCFLSCPDTLDLPCVESAFKTRYESLLLRLGVNKQVKVKEVVRLLKAMKGHDRQSPLSSAELKSVIALIKYLVAILKSKDIRPFLNKYGELYVPDSNSVMIPSTQLHFSDKMNGKVNDSLKFTHKSINRDIAVSLGIKLHVEKQNNTEKIMNKKPEIIDKIKSSLSTERCLFDIVNFINGLGFEDVHFVHDQSSLTNQIADNLLSNITNESLLILFNGDNEDNQIMKDLHLQANFHTLFAISESPFVFSSTSPNSLSAYDPMHLYGRSHSTHACESTIGTRYSTLDPEINDILSSSMRNATAAIRLPLTSTAKVKIVKHLRLLGQELELFLGLFPEIKKMKFSSLSQEGSKQTFSCLEQTCEFDKKFTKKEINEVTYQTSIFIKPNTTEKLNKIKENSKSNSWLISRKRSSTMSVTLLLPLYASKNIEPESSAINMELFKMGNNVFFYNVIAKENRLKYSSSVISELSFLYVEIMKKHIELDLHEPYDLYPLRGDLHNHKLKELPSAVVCLISSARLFPYLDYPAATDESREIDDEEDIERRSRVRSTAKSGVQSTVTPPCVRRYASAGDLHLPPLAANTSATTATPSTPTSTTTSTSTDSPLTRALRRLNVRLIDLPEECLLPATINRPVASRLLRQLRCSPPTTTVPTALTPTTTTTDVRLSYNSSTSSVDLENDDIEGGFEGGFEGERNAFGFTSDEAVALLTYLRPSLTSLDGLPLCVRCTSSVGLFPAVPSQPQSCPSRPLYHNRYAHLLPDLPEYFAHPDVEEATGSALLRVCLSPFDVSAFARLLRKQLPSSVYCSRLRDYFVWEAKAREQTLTDQWAASVWAYLCGLADVQTTDGFKEEGGATNAANSSPARKSNNFFNAGSLRSISVKSPLSPVKSPLSPVKSPLSPVKSPVKSTVKSPRLTNGSSGVRDLHLLDDWYIIPAIQQRGNTKIKILVPTRMSRLICRQSHGGIESTLKELGTPVLVDYLAENRTLARISLNPEDPYQVLDALEFALANLAKPLKQNQCEHIIKYFSLHYENELHSRLRRLPVFPTVLGDYISLSSSSRSLPLPTGSTSTTTTSTPTSNSSDETIDYLSIDSYGVDAALFETLQTARVKRWPLGKSSQSPASKQQEQEERDRGAEGTTTATTTTTTKTVFLKPDPNYSGVGNTSKYTLYSKLCIGHLTTSQFYERYVAVNLHLLPASSRGRYLYRLRGMFEYDDAVDLTGMRFIDAGEEPEQQEQEQEQEDACGVKGGSNAPLRRAGEFYSSRNEIYRVMLKRNSFLPEPYDSLEWHPFMVKCGLREKPTNGELLKMAKKLKAKAKDLAPTADNHISVSDKACALLSYVCSQDFHYECDSFMSDLANIPFIPCLDTGKLKAVHQAYGTNERANKLVCMTLKNSLTSTNLEIAWTCCYLLPQYASRVEFKKFSRSTPTESEILSNLRNIIQSDCRIPYVTVVMSKIYTILEETLRSSQVSRTFLNKLADMKFIYVDGDFVSAKKLSFEILEKDQIPPYLMKLPESLDLHYRLFKEIGITRLPSFQQFSFTLEQLHCNIGDRELCEIDVKRVHLAVKGYIRTFNQSQYVNSPDESEGSQPPPLYLISSSNQLVNSRLLVYDDDTSLSRRLSSCCSSSAAATGDDEDKHGVANGNGSHGNDNTTTNALFTGPLRGLRGFAAPARIYDLDDVDFTTLPPPLRPLTLSQEVAERLGDLIDFDADLVDYDSIGDIATSLKQRFNSTKFSSSIWRLVQHQTNSQKEVVNCKLNCREIESCLRGVKIRAVYDLYTYLQFKGEYVENTEMRRQCFLDTSEGNSVIYIDCKLTSLTPDLCAGISEILVCLLGCPLPLHVVMATLATPLLDLRPLLDRMRIAGDPKDSGHRSRGGRDDESSPTPTQIHRTGSSFPMDQRHLLSTDYEEFEVSEMVVYRKDDDETESSFVYARVLRQIIKVDDVPYVTGHYLIDAGPEDKIQVSSVELYKLHKSRSKSKVRSSVPGSRDHTPSRSSSFKRRSMVDTGQSATGIGHTPRSSTNHTPLHTPLSSRRQQTRPQRNISPELSNSESEQENQFESDLLSRRRNRLNGSTTAGGGGGDMGGPQSSTPKVSTARQQRQRDQRDEKRRLDKLQRSRREEEARLRRKHGLDADDVDGLDADDLDDVDNWRGSSRRGREYTGYRSRFYTGDDEDNRENGTADVDAEDREDVLEGEEPQRTAAAEDDNIDDEIDTDRTSSKREPCNDSRIADFIGAKDSDSKNAMKEEMKKLADDIEQDLNAVSDELEQAWSLEDSMRRKIVKRLMLKWHPDKNPDNVKVSTIVMQHIYKEIERLTEGLPRPEQFKDFDFSNIDPRNPFAQSDKFKANYYQSYKDFFEKVQKRSKENREERRRYKEQKAKAKPARKGFGYDFKDDNEVDRTSMFIKQAEIDLISSYNDYCNQEEFVKTANYEWACFKSHQAAEKALKAAQFFTDNSTSFSHDLMSIAATIKDVEIRKLANCLQKIIGESSKFYNADPLDFHSTIPHDEYSDEMALDCSKYAGEILDKVKEYIEIQKNAQQS